MPTVTQPQHQQQQVLGFKRILVATDFSDASQRVLPWAFAIARHYGAEVYLVHAIPPDAREPITVDPLPKALDRDWTQAEESMRHLAGQVREHFREIHTLLKQGPPSVVIPSVIQSEGIDLLILGTHGRGGLKKLVLGSVAEELLRLAPCPVLTIGGNIPAAMPVTGDFQRILFATDFGPAAEKVLQYALSLGEQNKAKLWFLHMVPPLPIVNVGPEPYGVPTYTGEELAQWEATQRQESQKKLKQMIPLENKLAFEPELVTVTDFLPEGILTVAAERNVDLIAMGANRTGSARTAAHAPWTVLHHIIAEARCPILTVTA